MAEHDQRFDSFEQWINKADPWLTRHPKYDQSCFHVICIDTKGRICRHGGDFIRASHEGTFPIRWWWPDQTIEEVPRVDQLTEALGNVTVEIAGAMLAIGDPAPRLAIARLNDALDIIKAAKAGAPS